MICGRPFPWQIPLDLDSWISAELAGGADADDLPRLLRHGSLRRQQGEDFGDGFDLGVPARHGDTPLSLVGFCEGKSH